MDKEIFLVNPRENGGHERMSREYASQRGAKVFYKPLPFLFCLLKNQSTKGVLCLGTVYQRPILQCLLLLFLEKRVLVYIPFFRLGNRFHCAKMAWVRVVTFKFKVITISEFEKSNIRHFSGGTEVYIRENSCDYDPVLNDSRTPVSGGGSSRLEVSIMGRLDNPQKNISQFLEFCEGMQHNISVTLIGGGDASKYPSVKVVDFVDNPWLYCQGVLVIPSVYEGVPLVLLEAYRRKVPVICNAIPELEYMVKRDYCIDFSNRLFRERFLQLVEELSDNSFPSSKCFTSAAMRYGELDESTLAFGN